MSKTPEEIKQSIVESRAKYNARKLADTMRRTTIKQGIKYIHDNKLENNIDEIDIDNWLVSLCYREEYEHTIRYSFCIKSPKDKYSFKTVKGLLGYRLSTEDCCHHFFHQPGLSKKGKRKAVKIAFLYLLYNENAIKLYGIPKKLVEYFNSEEYIDITF